MEEKIISAPAAEQAAPKANAGGLLPILVFLVIYIGSGVIFNDFYAMPAIAGFVVALVVAFLQAPKKSFDQKLAITAKGMGDENVMVMCIIFIFGH